MNTNRIKKVIAVPLLMAAAFGGLNHFVGSPNIASASTDTQNTVNVELPTTGDLDTPEIVEIPEVQEMSLELREALDALEHALAMAEEVRAAMEFRANDTEPRITTDSRMIPEVLTLEEEFLISSRAITALRYQGLDVLHAAMIQDQEFANAVEAAIYHTQTAMETILEGDTNIGEILELRDQLVGIYEPNGPYENRHNFPTQWLAALPNGDPRNLPYQWRVEIGPEVIATTWREAGIPLPGNNSEAPGDITGTFEIDLFTSTATCIGPSIWNFDADWKEHVFGGLGGYHRGRGYWDFTEGICFPFNEKLTVQSTDAYGDPVFHDFQHTNNNSLDTHRFFNYFNSDAMSMEVFSHWNSFSFSSDDPELVQIANAIRERHICTTVNLDLDGNLVHDNLDFERDSNGRIIFNDC